jgi:hypothetical protein
MKMLRGDGPGARQGRRLCAALVLTATAILAAGPAEAGARELLGQWPLNEGSGQLTADVSGKGHDGRLGASAAPDSHDPDWVPGRFGRGLRFLGEANQYVALAQPATLAPARITVEAWIRRLGTPGRWRYIVSSGGQDCNFASFGLYTGSTNGLAFYVSGGGRYELSPSAAAGAAWDGAWHYAVGTYDGAHVRLYLDGAEVGAGSPTQLAISYGLASREVYLGTYRGSCEIPFTGDVDDVEIHDHALSAGEVAAEAAAAAQRALPPQPAPVAGPPAGSPGLRSCLSLRVTPRRLMVHRRTRVRVAVRRLGRAMVGKRVVVRGRGLRVSSRTGRRGRARLTVRPKRLGRLRVTVVGQPRRCAPARLKVRRARG